MSEEEYSEEEYASSEGEGARASETREGWTRDGARAGAETRRSEGLGLLASSTGRRGARGEAWARWRGFGRG